MNPIGGIPTLHLHLQHSERLQQNAAVMGEQSPDSFGNLLVDGVLQVNQSQQWRRLRFTNC